MKSPYPSVVSVVKLKYWNSLLFGLSPLAKNDGSELNFHIATYTAAKISPIIM